ncbi:hypothetical protein SDC9_123039 [bioreactor metagenome]|uniref:Uncharacterized protein n=1 Tax=bioreactor metagenome TaxID=1076179 RepID=A0A645CGH4_9ZZZZ
MTIQLKRRLLNNSRLFYTESIFKPITPLLAAEGGKLHTKRLKKIWLLVNYQQLTAYIKKAYEKDFLLYVCFAPPPTIRFGARERNKGRRQNNIQTACLPAIAGRSSPYAGRSQVYGLNIAGSGAELRVQLQPRVRDAPRRLGMARKRRLGNPRPSVRFQIRTGKPGPGIGPGIAVRRI